MAQFDPDPNYDQRLADRTIAYLQTRDWRLFPFSEHFTADQERAFIRDLREGLADLMDSGSARKTSAVGFIMRDERLRSVVSQWAAAKGEWPEGSDPRNPEASLGSLSS